MIKFNIYSTFVIATIISAVFSVFCQQVTIQILDAQTSDPIEAAEVIKGGKKFLSNQKGKVTFQDISPETPILIIANGYKNRQVFVDSLSFFQIFLEPISARILDTVVLKSRINKQYKQLKWGGKFIPLSISPNKHLAQSFIVTDELTDKKLISLEFAVIPYTLNKSWKYTRNKFTFTKYNDFQVLIFQDSISKDNLLYQSQTISVRSDKKTKIKLDLEKENIFLSKGEFIIVLRHLKCKPNNKDDRPTRCFLFFRSGKKISEPFLTQTYFVRNLFTSKQKKLKISMLQHSKNKKAPDNQRDKHLYMKLKLQSIDKLKKQ